MSTKTKLFSASLILAAGLMTGGIARAQTADNFHTEPQKGDNRCWGEAASSLAKMGKDDSIPGGGMGSHSRSRNAADINGGFRNSDNPFAGDPTSDGQPRLGVGNATRTVHNADGPRKGGQGVHAVNNSNGFTEVADAVTGGSNLGETNTEILPGGCSTGLNTTIDLVPN